MHTWIIDRWLGIRASYWFIPSVVAATAVCIAVLLVYLEANTALPWLNGVGIVQPIAPAGARSLLSTVAGSMITVAGVTFSMTLLAVSHASAQIGPRLMASYMEDRGNQVTLGTLTAGAAYWQRKSSSTKGPPEA